MDLLTIFLVALGLAMDAFAVSIAKGVTVKINRCKTAIVLATFFGGFQMVMPVIGWVAGMSLKDVIVGIDHWIAFGLLSLIGAKMFYESTKDAGSRSENEIKITTALILAVATSIDALMVGLSFAFLETSIVLPIAVIGVVTFLLSSVGFFFGCSLSKVFGKRIEIVGGIMLIAIGVRILVEHLFWI